jgi:hypothetical protein
MSTTCSRNPKGGRSGLRQKPLENRAEWIMRADDYETIGDIYLHSFNANATVYEHQHLRSSTTELTRVAAHALGPRSEILEQGILVDAPALISPASCRATKAASTHRNACIRNRSGAERQTGQDDGRTEGRRHRRGLNSIANQADNIVEFQFNPRLIHPWRNR